MKFSKETILSFADYANINAFKNAFAVINGVITDIMTSIMQRNANIKGFEILTANEVFNGTEFAGSTIDLFLHLDAKQIELYFNEKEKFKLNSYFSNFRKLFIENFKLYTRKSKKANEKRIAKQEKKILSLDKYDVKNFYKDLQLQLCKRLHNTTQIILNSTSLKIIGKDEFGITINIYPVFSCDKGYVLYNTLNKKSTIINFGDKFYNVKEKNKQTCSFFKIQTRILNNMFWNIFKQSPNQIFIESLLYNVPTNFFTHNIYGSTLKIINYLKNSDINKFVSICNNETKMFNETINTTRLETAYKFIKSIELE